MNLNVLENLDLALGTQMDPRHRLELALVQAFAGNYRYRGNLGNQYALENHWYTYWQLALQGFLQKKTRGILVAPQFVISKSQVTNDGKPRRTSKIPDFSLLFLDGHLERYRREPLEKEKVTNHETLAEFYRGDCIVADSTLLLLCEIKALPKVRPGARKDNFKLSLNIGMARAFLQAQNHLDRQLYYYFSTHKRGGIVALGCVGNYFCWSDNEYGQVSTISSNVDSTYSPSTDTDSSSESTEDVEVQTHGVLGELYPNPRGASMRPRPLPSQASSKLKLQQHGNESDISPDASRTEKKGKKPQRDPRPKFAVRSINSVAVGLKPSDSNTTAKNTVNGKTTDVAGNANILRAINRRMAPMRKTRADALDPSGSGPLPPYSGPPLQQDLRWSPWMSWTSPEAQIEKERMWEAIRGWNADRSFELEHKIDP